MEKLGHLADRWRYAVVAVEVLVAGGCLYFGWNVVARQAAAAQIRVPGQDGLPCRSRPYSCLNSIMRRDTLAMVRPGYTVAKAA